MAKPIDAVVVKICGSVGIRSIAAPHQKLLQAIEDNGAVVLDVDGVTGVDLAFVQLIEAARLRAAAQGKHISLSRPVHDGLHDCLLRGGFLSGAVERRFWLHEEECR